MEREHICECFFCHKPTCDFCIFNPELSDYDFISLIQQKL